jgi:hypothetical protein
VPIDHASLPGFDERVGDLDPIGMEGEGASPYPVESLGTPANVDVISVSMVGLCLHANEAWASGGLQPHGFDHMRLECQLDTILGPRPSQEDLHCLHPVTVCLVAAHGGTTILPSTNGMALWVAQCRKDLQPSHMALKGPCLVLVIE